MNNLPTPQNALIEVWEKHLKYEFEDRDENLAVSTMVEDAFLNHIPTMSGSQGRDAVRQYYGAHFVPCIPPDLTITPISRTVGDDRLVDEMVVEFTHTITMDWILPGLPPTGLKVKIPLVAIVYFRDGKIAREHIYWDQASVLVQLGLLSRQHLPVTGAEAAERTVKG